MGASAGSEGQDGPGPEGPITDSKRPLSTAELADERLTSDAEEGRPCSSTREPLASISDEHMLVDIPDFWRTGPCTDTLVRVTDSSELSCLDLSCGHSCVLTEVAS